MSRTPMARRERLALTCAALTGAVRAVTTWLLDQITP